MPRFLPRRPLGRDHLTVTALGQGDLADRSLGVERCAATLRRALDAGVNLLDTAPMYEDGFSEEVVGAALRGRREGVLVVTKIDHLDRPVGPQLDDSLARLGLPAVDLLALHSVSQPADWAKVAAPGGAMEQLREERRRGRTRLVGISSHHPDVLAAALDAGACDVLMFPVGPFVHRRYVDEILPRARSLGVGTIGFKAFGGGKLVADTEGYGKPLSGSARDLPRLSVEECLHATLTLDPDCALLGLSTPGEQDLAFAAAESFAPLAPARLEDVRRRAAEAARGKGRAWWDPQPA
jgi:aryl-alcohol dehydrogenase-like predicted oxidoreductase